MKKILLTAALSLCSFNLFAGSLFGPNIVTDPEITDPSVKLITIGAPKAPPIIPVLRMIQTKAMGEKVAIRINWWETPEQLIAMVQNGDNDIYAFPLTVISKLYNKGFPVQLTNVNTWGAAYFFSSDPSVKTWKDLKGKEIYVPLKSSPPDIMTQYFLKQAGLQPGDFKLNYASKMEVAKLMIAGKAEHATMIEPLATMVSFKNSDMKRIMTFEKEWQRIRNTDKKIPNAGMGATKKFVAENKDLLIKFEQEYEKATNWILANNSDAASLGSMLGLKSMLLKKALPNMGIEYKSAQNAKAELDEFFQMLFEFNPKSVGGKVPDAKMYFDN